MIILYYLLPVFGAVPTLIIYLKFRKTNYIKSKGITTNATVIKVEPWGNSSRTRMDILTLHYEVEAEKRIYQGSASADPWKYKVGDSLQVAYLPEDPKKMTVIVKHFYTAMFVFTILIFLVVLVLTYKMFEELPIGI